MPILARTKDGANFEFREFQLANDGMGHDFDKPLSVKGF